MVHITNRNIASHIRFVANADGKACDRLDVKNGRILLCFPLEVTDWLLQKARELFPGSFLWIFADADRIDLVNDLEFCFTFDAVLDKKQNPQIIVNELFAGDTHGEKKIKLTKAEKDVLRHLLNLRCYNLEGKDCAELLGEHPAEEGKNGK